MKATDFTQPELLLRIFAEDGTRNTLPLINEDTTNKQRADLTNGFPIYTQGDPSDGKLPPERADFNALGHLTTSYDFFYQAGGVFTYSSNIATAIEGYPKGARLWYTNSAGVSMLLESTKDDNEDDFTDDESYIGTSWKIVSFVGIDNSNIRLLDYMFRDKQVNNMSWVISDGSWLSGSTYTSAYNHLVDAIGYRAVDLLNSKNIYVTATNAGFSGYAIRRSSLDKTVEGTAYYAWNTSSSDSYDKTIYLTLNVDSMSVADALQAMQGQRIYKTTDGTAFTATVNKITSSTVDTYTINGSDVDLEVMVGSNGEKIVLQTNDEDSTLNDIYNSTGIAWYYLLDKGNTRFKLPRTTVRTVVDTYNDGVNWYRVYSDGWCEQGGYNAGNATVTFLKPFSSTNYNIQLTDKAYYTNGSEKTNITSFTKTQLVLTAQYPQGCYWKCSGYISNVQKNSQYKYLYFYVGGFNDAAVEQTAGINASTINSKADIDLGNLSFDGWEKVGVPDFSSGVSLTLSTTNQTIGYSGYIYCGNTDNGITNTTRHLYIDDVGISVVGSSAGNCCSSVLIPVNKDATYRLNIASGVNLIFYPRKEA